MSHDFPDGPDFNPELPDEDSAWNVDATSYPQEERVNYYGQPIIDPAYFMDAHVVNPMGPGEPPVCSCGWTPWTSPNGVEFTMSDHLADMGEYVNGVNAPSDATEADLPRTYR